MSDQNKDSYKTDPYRDLDGIGTGKDGFEQTIIGEVDIEKSEVFADIVEEAKASGTYDEISAKGEESNKEFYKLDHTQHNDDRVISDEDDEPEDHDDSFTPDKEFWFEKSVEDQKDYITQYGRTGYEVEEDDDGDEMVIDEEVETPPVAKSDKTPKDTHKPADTPATELESRFYTGFVEHIQSENALLYLLNKRIGDTEIGVRKVRILTSLLYILVGIAIGLGIAALLGYRYVGFDRPPAEPPTMSVPAE